MAKHQLCHYPLCQNYDKCCKSYCDTACEDDHDTLKALKRRAAKKDPRVRRLRVLVCGSRHWTYRKAILRELSAIKDQIDVVIEGGAAGADTMGREEAWRLHLPAMTLFANWPYLHKAAGPIRNRWMLKYGRPDLVLAFHMDIENSSGTKDMIKAARHAGVKVKLVEG
jgi:hypothetical protein